LEFQQSTSYQFIGWKYIDTSYKVLGQSHAGGKIKPLHQ